MSASATQGGHKHMTLAVYYTTGTTLSLSTDKGNKHFSS